MQDIIDNNAAFPADQEDLCADGKGPARFLIAQNVDPANPGTSRVDPIHDAAMEALKGTLLESANIIFPAAAGPGKLVEGRNTISSSPGFAALCLIFIIMLLMTRSLIAALVYRRYRGTLAGASFRVVRAGLQYLLSIQLNWVVLGCR